MPKPVSKKQLRYIKAILSEKKGSSKRGDEMPASVAKKYDSEGNGKSLDEDKGKALEGGRWPKGSGRHPDGKKKKKEDDKKKDDVEKSDEKHKGAGLIVLSEGKILLGRSASDDSWGTPGGHKDSGETWEQTAIRECKEESGIEAISVMHVADHNDGKYESKTFATTDWKGSPTDTEEMHSFEFVSVADLPWDDMRPCSADGIKAYLTQRLDDSCSKSLSEMLALEKAKEVLSKNIVRSGQVDSAVSEISHGQAMHLVGNGTFRLLREAVSGMGDEDFKDVKIDTYVMSIRKHVNDIYSGRISDGHKMIHQFTNKSLPELTAELMSVFEWYSPEDEGELLDLDTHLDDTDIEGGLQHLINEYDKHNIKNIYHEMESIRTDIRNGNAVDLQQVEAKLMALFDKLESTVQDITSERVESEEQHGDAMQGLEHKLQQLQAKVEAMGKEPVSVKATMPDPSRADTVHSNDYPWLTRPSIEISPTGTIRISFGNDWQHMEINDFLSDMKARVVKQRT